MAFSDFMQKVRYWDNLVAKWVLRHLYFVFFQTILVIIFVIWFNNTLHVLSNIADVNNQTGKPSNLENIMISQSVNITLLTFLLILNAFWVLFIFNGLQRIQFTLKDMSYSLSRMRDQNKDRNNKHPG